MGAVFVPMTPALVQASNTLLGRAQPVIPPNLYSLFINIKAWGPKVTNTSHLLMLSVQENQKCMIQMR